MSLTTFVAIPEVRKVLLEHVHKPEIPYPHSSKMPMVVVPLHDRYALMGTAFDYALRTLIMAKFNGALRGNFIAQLGVMKAGESRLADMETVEKMIKIIDDCLHVFEKRLVNDEFANACLNLANLDTILRTDRLPANIPYAPSRNELDDLKHLSKLALEKYPFPERSAYLNPTFGAGSDLVGGGDADLIVDGILIDIKTTKKFLIDRSYINQIVGYLVLHYINKGKVDVGENCPIAELGIYFSRHGVLLKWPIEDIISEKSIVELAEFFADFAESNLSPHLEAREMYDEMDTF